MLYTKPLQTLIAELQKLPGIGAKSAQRLAFHILRQPDADVRKLASALVEAKERIRTCSRCCNLSEVDPCELCLAPRDDAVVCLVAEPRDLVALERTREFKGRYHVLGGLISPMDGIGPDQLKIAELLARLQSGAATDEIILALGSTIEGEATSLYLTRLLKPLGLKVTRLAFGLPMGAELEYADEVTLARALVARREV